TDSALRHTAIRNALSRHILTRDLTAPDIDYLVERGQVTAHAPGTALFHESQPRREFGLLLSGKLELRKSLKGRPSILAYLGPGETFGEGSLLDQSQPHSTTGIVREQSEVLVIPSDVVDEIMRERPQLYARLVKGAAHIIASRLRSANVSLAGRSSPYLSSEVRREKDLLGERDV